MDEQERERERERESTFYLTIFSYVSRDNSSQRRTNSFRIKEYALRYVTQ